MKSLIRKAAQAFSAAAIAAGFGAAQETSAQTLYDTVRGWEVSTMTAPDGSFAGCLMRRPGGGFDLSIARFDGRTELGFPTTLPEGTPVAIDMDVDRYSEIANAFVRNGWASVPVQEDWVQAIGKAKYMEATVNGRGGEISTSGTMAAILKLQECDKLGGHRPAPAPTQTVENDTLRMGAGCPALGQYRSPNVQDWGDITFVNRADRAITVYWLNGDGIPQDVVGLLPGEQAEITSNAGHYFIAKDSDMTCHGGVIEVPFRDSLHEIH